MLDKFKFLIKDSSQSIKRIFPGKFKGDKKNKLEYNQIYPNGNNLTRLFQIEAKNLLGKLEFKEDFKISSIGTCFAEEVSYYFSNSKEYNYLKLEDNFFNFSANWGRVYTIKNLHQIINYSFKDNFPIYYEFYNKKYFDPLREYSVGSFNNLPQLKKSIVEHRIKSKEIFKNSDIIIITLGQNEYWLDSSNNYAWGRTPPVEMRTNSKRFMPVDCSFSKNLNLLKSSIELIRKFNPKIKIIFTVSPVPQYATFTSKNIISKSFSAKCILRSVVSEIINLYSNLYYFPSFEYVLTQNPFSYNSDNRHIKRLRVKKIMNLIDKSLK